ncbi:hypothetical protein SDC9_128395 [bioreactor metagenome]|uniref:Uncharacterized protein n=1 Tax=bioreactor metagenome TaxID=1076179 RepID=A0A645CWU3_9ZZZZ
MPASALPIANVNEIVRLILMPMSCAASVSSETARIALPILVFWTRNVNKSIETAAAMSVMTAVPESSIEPRKIDGILEKLGMTCAFAPKTICERFSNRKETPIAVMSNEILGEPRRGL